MWAIRPPWFQPRSLQLRKKCVKLLETFNPKATTVDAYFEDAPFLKDPLLGEVELKFIHQVFYGCYRYGKLLKLFVTSLLYKAPATAVRSEQSLYMVLAYLLFFRPDGSCMVVLALALALLSGFRLCPWKAGRTWYGRPAQVHHLRLRNPTGDFRTPDAWRGSSIFPLVALFALLSASSCLPRQYALDKEEMNKWVMEEWLKHYDPAYLEEDSGREGAELASKL